MNELHLTPKKNLVWRETARWLKFMEVVEGNGQWSKPHVATISLHMLIELRNILSNGCFIMDYLAFNSNMIIGTFLI